MSAVLYANDLMFSSRVSSAARRSSVSLAVVCTQEDAEKALGSGKVRLLMIDLTARQLDVQALVAACGRQESSPTVVAYGPHVDEAALTAAAQAGCDQVLSKGQFDQQMNDLLRSVAE